MMLKLFRMFLLVLVAMLSCCVGVVENEQGKKPEAFCIRNGKVYSPEGIVRPIEYEGVVIVPSDLEDILN